MPSIALRTAMLSWRVCRGRNGWDAPSILDEDMAADAINVRIVRGKLPTKRYGSVSVNVGNANGYNALARFIPAQNDAAAELIIVTRGGGTPSAAEILRVTAEGSSTILSLADPFEQRPQDFHTAILNGKLFMAYNSGVNRLHVYDPKIATGLVRRTGLGAPPPAPSAADEGGGPYPETRRWYRVQWFTLHTDGTVLLASSLGTPLDYTPIGPSLAGVRVTRPESPGFPVTHWALWGSDDDQDYYLLTPTTPPLLIGTTSWLDQVEPANYPDGIAAPPEGSFTNWPSVKFLCSTGDRLLGFGVYETTQAGAHEMTPKNGRVYFSPVMDTTDTDDEERVSNSLAFKGWIDIARDAGAEDRAIIGPMDNQIFCFQSRGITMLVPTEDAIVPYKRVQLSTTIGAVSQWSTFLGDDELGRPCVYWLDPEIGPMRYGFGGFQWIGYDVQDVWATVNLAATERTAHGVYDAAERTCKWWFATDLSNDPNHLIVFNAREGHAAHRPDEIRGGWTRDVAHRVASARCSVMFPDRFAPTAMSRVWRPYAGFQDVLLRTDDPAATTDMGTTFPGLITSRGFDLRLVSLNKKLGKSYLQAESRAGVTIEQTFIRNYGDEANRKTTVLLTPVNGERRVLKRFEDAGLVDWYVCQVKLGDQELDVTGWAATWALDEWWATVEYEDER